MAEESLDQQSDIMDMSDEEFLQLDPPDIHEKEPIEEDSEEEESSDEDTNQEESEEEQGEEEESDDTEKEEDSDADEESDPGEEETTPAEPIEIDYEVIGKQLMGEFKANGKVIKPKSVEDAIQLMQMGANYHKKMSGLKPSLKTLKLLEKNGLLDPEKLNFLIDLNQNNPEAITKLLQDNKIDPMAIDLDAENNYTPQNRSVSDKEIILDDVLDSISQSDFYNKTLTVLGDEWDDTSRNTIAENPDIIRTINLHMENGIYDQVSNAVAYERSLGKFLGVSDLEAYQQVGNHMDSNKLFTAPNGSPAQQQVDNNAQREADTQKQTRATRNDEQRQSRKRAASPSRQKKTSVADNSNYDPLSMSDEDFIKLNKLSL